MNFGNFTDMCNNLLTIWMDQHWYISVEKIQVKIVPLKFHWDILHFTKQLMNCPVNNKIIHCILKTGLITP